jgi:hypothetical protein
MSRAGAQMRALLVEAQEIAEAQFGADKVRDVPLLVTYIALTMTQIDEGDRVSSATASAAAIADMSTL